jgi:tetratricopeptide (TPR) repeat protein
MPMAMELREDQTSREHALRHLALAEAMEPKLWGRDVVASLEALEIEHDHLRSALKWALKTADGEVALRLTAALWRFWEIRGYQAEGLGWIEQALAHDHDVAIEVRARALDAAGNLARSLGSYDRATKFYVRSLQLRLKLGDTRGVALALNNLAVNAQFEGKPDASLAHQEASIDLFRELGDPAGVALSLITLGAMAQLQGRGDSARGLYEESLALFRAIDDKRGVAACLNNLGNTASDGGQVATASRCYEEALELFRELGDKSEEAACLKNLSLVALAGGDLGRAAGLCQMSLETFDELADGRGVAACLEVLSRVLCAEQRFEAAARILGAAEGLRLLLGVPVGTPLAGGQSQAQDTVRTALGEEIYLCLAGEGRMMPLAEAIAGGMASLGEPRD